MNASFNPDKLLILPFYKGCSVPGFLMFEKVLLHGLMGKLSLFTKIHCKNFAAKESLPPLDPKASLDLQLKELQTLALNNRAGYLLTGSMSPHLDGHQTIASIRIRLRLYDAMENRFALDTVYTLKQIDPAHNTLQEVSIPMEALNPILNWATFHLINLIQPEEASTLFPQIAPHRFGRSYKALRLLVEADETSEASQRIELYEQAIQQDPTLEIAYWNLGKLYRNVKAYERSIYHYQKAFELCPQAGRTKATYATEIGIGFALLKQHEHAIEWWNTAIESDPSYLNPYLNVAHTYEEQESYPQAETYFTKAQALAPDDIRTYVNLARVYSKMGAWPKAIEQYKVQLSKDDQDPWCHSNLATCYLQLGQSHDALYHFEKTATLDPTGEAGQYAKLLLGSMSGAVAS